MTSDALLNLAFERSFGQTRTEIHHNQNQKKLLVSAEIFQHPELANLLTLAYNQEVVNTLNPLNFEIHFHEHALNTFKDVLSTRECLRYDFQHEWNNLGYGAITFTSHSPFSIENFYTVNKLSQKQNIKIEKIASLFDKIQKKYLSDYILLFKTADTQILWINRPIGNYDGFDWKLVENFFLDVTPVISEIPADYQFAVTHRIDCDESIKTGRPLVELYHKNQIAFSMAIKTEQAIEKEDIKLMQEVVKFGGTIATHSHTHKSNWGGSFAAAQFEVTESHKVLKSLDIKNINYTYAVSPFHQNSETALQGIHSVGIKGVVGGIICNDPEFVTARAGRVIHSDLIFHTEQCMLHGETYHQQNNQMQAYFKSVDLAFTTQTFFGYLDHPFSNYHYGWASEEERLHVHQEMIHYINSHQDVWWASLEQALDFLYLKSKIKVQKNQNHWVVTSHEDIHTQMIIEKFTQKNNSQTDSPAQNLTLPLRFKIYFKNSIIKYSWGEKLELNF